MRVPSGLQPSPSTQPSIFLVQTRRPLLDRQRVTACPLPSTVLVDGARDRSATTSIAGLQASGCRYDDDGNDRAPSGVYARSEAIAIEEPSRANEPGERQVTGREACELRRVDVLTVEVLRVDRR